ncbi:MAG: TIGR04141 family sporadically distributed protein [Betaproteobacteria bacterium]|nr:TIGR04141 family sporadically distributed protein [Betaproteobacteria bacterium]
MREKPRKERLCIYLAKTNYRTDDILIDTAGAIAPYNLILGEGQASLYIKREVTRLAPPWTNLFTSLPSVPDNAFGSTNSVGAVLIYRYKKRIFLLSFGHGFHLIKDHVVERDFGLRVTLNSVEPGKLRSLDKASYDHNPLNSRIQSSKDVDIFDLEMDSEMEMLYAITGVSKEPVFGSHVTGRDALTIVVATDAKGIGKILWTALQKFNAKLPSEFEWVDNINTIRDPTQVKKLDDELDKLLSNGAVTSLWLGEPEIVDWESQVGYSFDNYAKTPRHIVLELSQLESYLTKKDQALTVDVLKTQLIHVNDSEYKAIKSWPAYRCLYAEITYRNEQYILRNGTWYRVKKSFMSEIDEYLKFFLPSCALVFPKYACEREDEYNKHVVSIDASYHLMDKKNVPIGGPYDKVEFCDLIKDSTMLIHVKYYRSSSTLSHLFAQGHIASEAFVKDEDFRIRLNKKLPKGRKLTDPKTRPDPSKYTVVYAIATKKNIPKELPFFSKVTLKNAVKTLRALNYKVELAAIPIDPMLAKTSLCKPAKSKRK